MPVDFKTASLSSVGAHGFEVAARSLLDPGPGGTELGLAVSGGGDSMAMLHMVAGLAALAGVPVRAVTVNHALLVCAIGKNFNFHTYKF